MVSPLSWATAGLLLLAAAPPTPWRPPDPPGPYSRLRPDDLKAVRSFARTDRVVGTYFFYWYDVHSGAHFVNRDGTDALVDHPADVGDYSYLSEAWWRKEMRDVRAAGIDFITPVYWGVPGDYGGWSFRGLPPLVRAWDAMAAAGEDPPRVGLFYDTSTLRHGPGGQAVDLSTEEGKLWFYATIRDFFSLIPPRLWAAVEGKPVVFLYSAAFAAKQDPELFPFVRARFLEDFGCEPYIVREVSWRGDTDALYAWGGALRPQLYSVSSVGPGYDHHAVPGRTPLVVDREGGAFYRRSWEVLLARKLERRATMVMVETWNELHEGTDICETKEYGRQYIELTAEYVKRFKAGEVVPHPSPFTGAPEVSLAFDTPDGARGVQLRPGGDGLFEDANLGGRPCRRTLPNPHGTTCYLYFDVDDGFLWDEDGVTVEVTLDYWATGVPAILVHYDHVDPARSVREGAFAPGPAIPVARPGEWQTATFRLEGCRFANRGNGGDFRLAVSGGELAVARVVVRRR
ncbi:MAG: DUF5010 domain-containing protein [Armatimonadota bacterium]|nr:DUF5010 domain-containing protein [Armatimonadota bacterium]